MMQPQSTLHIPDYLRGLEAANADAYARFLAMGLPAPKSEAYKYTHLPRALEFRSAPRVSSIAPIMAGPSQYARTEKTVAQYNANSSLVMLNDALSPETVVIDIPAGIKVDSPIFLTWHAPHHELVNPRVVINVGSSAEVCVVEAQSGQPTGWCNRVSDIHVAENATCKHYRHLGGDGVATFTTNVNVATAGVYDTLLINTGGETTRHDVNIDLTGARAHTSLKVANLLRASQHGDLTALVRHLAPNTQSNQTVRTILMDQARGVYQGKIYVDRVAQKTDGYQLSSALLLSPQAEMDTKPELEIYADDVKCSHGATTGALDDAQMFYLQSRGLPEAEARALLLNAFITSLFDGLDENLRARFDGIVEGWLK
jgi:Fe-S cluster assembly protein SufD